MTNSDRLQEIRERVGAGKRLRRKLQELENRVQGYRKQERPM